MDAVAKKQKHPDRITLQPDSLAKLGRWAEQVTSKNPGVRATRSDLVAWLIETHDEQLSSSELNGLEEKFFDSVKYAKWAVRAIIEAKARGEVLNLKLVSQVPKAAMGGTADSKKQKKLKSKSDAIAENSGPSASSLSQSEKDQGKDGTSWPDGN